jgi:V8-like Glu-specific endopeptidase/tetratricopeptide (TPR) repeat protein
MQPNASSQDEIYVQIREAVHDFDWDRVRRLAEAFTEGLRASNEPVQQTVKLVRLLLNNRQYDAVMDIADAALAVDTDNRRLWRYYAQALVDRGRIAPALRLYTAIADDPAATEEDQAEARGGIGRCYKQLFVSAGSTERRAYYLKRAIDAYDLFYQAHPSSFYHGINSAALLFRAARDGLLVPETTSLLEDESPVEAARRIADDVLKTVGDRDDRWAAVTACEAHIALGNDDDALIHARIFVSDSQTRAFDIASFLRQVEHIWQLKPDSPLGIRLLPLLRSALVRKNGGTVTVSSADLKSARIEELGQLSDTASDAGAHLEKVLGTVRFQTLQWWRTGLLRCRAVVRINDANGFGRGTGFLIDGRALHASFPDRVIVTNGHVVPEAIPRDEAVVAFHGLDADAAVPKFTIERVCWYSPASPPGVDTTVLKPSNVPDGVEPIPLANNLPVYPEDSRAYIIGHPSGHDQPQFSIEDNKVLGRNDIYLHYRSPTEGGSSGSPVFEGQWKVIGLHHAGGVTISRPMHDTYTANEALLIDAIRHAIDANPAGWPLHGRDRACAD